MDMLSEIKAAEEAAECRKAEARAKARTLLSEAQTAAEQEALAAVQAAKESAAHTVAAAKAQSETQIQTLRKAAESTAAKLSETAAQNQGAAVEKVLSYIL